MVEAPSILLVDDSQDTLEVLSRNLQEKGYRVACATGVSQAVEMLRQEGYNLVITDYKMPKVSGLDLVRHVRENLPDTEVMMITGYATVEGAVEAVKAGAEEYLTKPFTDEELLTAVGRALEKLRLRRAQRAAPALGPAVQGLLGESEPMRQVFQAISRAASTTATVLICGESGTGKEMVARAIHYQSPRATAPFIPVNCGGIPETLFESEMFGHVKGAYTGAVESRAGFFHSADGGSILLDEVSETTPVMQVKLLRVLQDRQVYMLGSDRSVQVDVRIMAASNKDLQTLVKRGSFREDLFYRLNVISIEVPPLRRRGEDVLLLARYFLDKFSRELDRQAPVLSDGAVRALLEYSWPGNVRELENLMQRLVVMTDEKEIGVHLLPPAMRFCTSGDAFSPCTLAEVEAEHIRQVLALVAGNKTRAAEILGIDRKTLREKLKRYSNEKQPRK
ncbi:MAG: sigma-54-dependent Fis family transcriptional regulator [Deltaproteobacteria bacterium]|nr:MAG: sigma-54-dependent Fis family transcriptional regulator [Deltaproteobacteria bacterium]